MLFDSIYLKYLFNNKSYNVFICFKTPRCLGRWIRSIYKTTADGLEFLFDVKTTLNISDVTFYESQTMHGYDLYASASDKEDILYLNLYNGK